MMWSAAAPGIVSVRLPEAPRWLLGDGPLPFPRSAFTGWAAGNVHRHDLRHAGATLSAQLGATTRELMARLGNASPRAALIYQHAAQERDRSLADARDQAAAPISGTDHRCARWTRDEGRYAQRIPILEHRR